MTLASDPITSGMTARSDGAAGRGDIVLGEDWDKPPASVEQELRQARERRGYIALKHSPLARKIILFNLLGIVVLVAGVLLLDPLGNSLVVQRERALAVEAQLIADAIEESIAAEDGATRPELAAQQALARIGFGSGAGVYLFTPEGALITEVAQSARNAARPVQGVSDAGNRPLLITDLLNALWVRVEGLIARPSTPASTPANPADWGDPLVADAMGGATILRQLDSAEGVIHLAATQVDGRAGPVAVLVLSTAAGEIDTLIRVEREELLQLFAVALLVSIGLSLVLASTIANPLSDLADAAELGRAKNARKFSPNRVRIPDLSGRPDEIGRLSGALRGMVGALYDRIDTNEQFAADVAHEIKNPLASLRSAVSTLRMANQPEQRDRLLDVIDHDVARLNRLVSDISNASRLDAELVKEDEEEFDLIRTLRNLSEYHASEAAAKGVDFITELPDAPLRLTGLEARLAQVFVNLLSNAISFCDAGDAVRIWARNRDGRVLVVVEDTGPGIPEDALGKVFNRFYSERPQSDFGNHSGLGLAISKQIVEAHGGVIWAENIRPTDADVTSEPLGARFVVGLPI